MRQCYSTPHSRFSEPSSPENVKNGAGILSPELLGVPLDLFLVSLLALFSLGFISNEPPALIYHRKPVLAPLGPPPSDRQRRRAGWSAGRGVMGRHRRKLTLLHSDVLNTEEPISQQCCNYSETDRTHTYAVKVSALNLHSLALFRFYLS